MPQVISVAMAVYNGEKYLAEQIDSILPQLDGTDELVISYDTSDDNTLSLIREYESADCRVRVLVNERPGVTGNFENAISNCRGDFIFISDQDDKWAPDKIKKVLDCFKTEQADLVIHNGVHTDENLNPGPQSFFEMYRIGPGKWKNILKPRYSGCCMAFTAKMKAAILPMPEIRGYDQWIATVCEFLGKIAYLDDVLIYHRLHANNVTPSSSRPLPVILKMRTRLVVSLIKRLIREKKSC